MNCEIHQEIVVAASPAAVYTALLDATQFNRPSATPATMPQKGEDIQSDTVE